MLGEKKGNPHDKLFWRLIHHGAIRKGDWKLIWFDDEPPRLYNLENDISERNDLSGNFPSKANELLIDFYEWEKRIGCTSLGKMIQYGKFMIGNVMTSNMWIH